MAMRGRRCQHQRVEQHLDDQRPRDPVHALDTVRVVDERSCPHHLVGGVVDVGSIERSSGHLDADDEDEGGPEGWIDAKEPADGEAAPGLLRADLADDVAAHEEEEHDAEPPGVLDDLEWVGHPVLDRVEGYPRASVALGPPSRAVVPDHQQHRDRPHESDGADRTGSVGNRADRLERASAQRSLLNGRSSTVGVSVTFSTWSVGALRARRDPAAMSAPGASEIPVDLGEADDR
jgi:hypothetical protein